MTWVTHEMDFARSVGDLMVFVDTGESVESKSSDEFFKNPESERTKFLPN